jgi:hypothetical protein
MVVQEGYFKQLCIVNQDVNMAAKKLSTIELLRRVDTGHEEAM